MKFNVVTYIIKDEIIKTKVCPANILAAKRIAKLNIRIKYEKISIGIKIGNRMKGHSGIKILKNFKLCVSKPIIKIDKQEIIVKNIITIIWLVRAIPNGNRLNKLQINTKIKQVKIKGK